MAVSGREMVTLVLLCGLLSSAAATVYNVGGDGGWTFQSQNSTFYDDQFQNITLIAGDTLNFTFTDGVHNLAWVTQQALANCDSTFPPIQIYLQTSMITLNTSGAEYGFICGFPQHCSQYGMHLNVSTLAGAGPAPSPAAG